MHSLRGVLGALSRGCASGPILALALLTASCGAAAPQRVVRAIAAGYGHACALTDAGTVWCWGHNAQGQLGTGDTIDRHVPTLVPGLERVVQLALQSSSSCALLADGTARCWGWNLRGQLGGDWTANERLVPTAVPGVAGAVEIALGDNHGCVRLEDQSVRCWGLNFAGAVGDGSGTRRPSATPVVDAEGELLTGVTALALGGSHSCALMKDESVRCWGLNMSGELGTGTTERWRFVPAPVVGLRAAKAIAACSYLTCALLADATVTCWGKTVGGAHWTNVPLPVSGLTGVTQLSLGVGEFVARIADGTVRFWGSPRLQPKTRLAGVESVAIGLGFACTLGAEGMQCWGSNHSGSLGDGTTHYSNEPKEVSW